MRPISLEDALMNQDAASPFIPRGHSFPCVCGTGAGGLEKGKMCFAKVITEHIPLLHLIPVYSICPSIPRLSASRERCPKCGAAADVYSRIAGCYEAIL